jgi:hypothetical protein
MISAKLTVVRVTGKLGTASRERFTVESEVKARSGTETRDQLSLRHEGPSFHSPLSELPMVFGFIHLSMSPKSASRRTFIAQPRTCRQSTSLSDIDIHTSITSILNNGIAFFIRAVGNEPTNNSVPLFHRTLTFRTILANL